MPKIVNTEMAKAWDGDEGEDWARDWERYDRAVTDHHAAFMQAVAARPGERVLDIGCGNGQATRDAALAVGEGSAHGVDLSSQMLERARKVSSGLGITNVTFEQADAQAHPFEREHYDVAISRFGSMFFADPVAAFANIATGLRPEGRIVLAVWRSLADNEWLQCFLSALAAGRDLPAPPVGAPGPFGLADPDFVRSTLEAAGYRDVALDPVDARIYFGSDADDAFGFFRTTGVTRGMLADLEDADRQRALDALRQTMVEHDTGDGVRFGSGTWIVSATRAAT